jgi:hypothetical protein
VLRGSAPRRVPTAALLATAAVLLAVLTTLAAYGTVSRDEKSGSSPVGRPSAESVRLVGTFPRERGPEGLQWQWMSDSAQLIIHGRGQYWLAFRAQSLGRPRTLSLSSPGQNIELRVTGTPTTQIIGPVMIFGNGRLVLSARPRARRATKLDKRRLAIFLSSPTLVRTAAAALPGVGFFQREVDARGVPFMWLSQNGRLDLISTASTRQVWLSFAAMSRLRRILIVADLSSGRRVGRIAIPGDGRDHSVILGPINLVGRRALLLVSVQPGPGPVGSDPRALSVRITGLNVATDRPVANVVPPR